MQWKTFDSAPVIENLLVTPAPRCLVYGPDIGIQIGCAWRYPEGDAASTAEGFNGDWLITHWMELPEKPL